MVKTILSQCSKCQEIPFYHLISPSTLSIQCSCNSQTLSLENFLSEHKSPPTFETNKMLCNKHNNNKYTDYCLDCKTHLCGDCLLFHNTKHKRLINFNRIESHYLPTIPSLINVAQSIISYSMKVEVDSAISILQKQIQNLKEAYDSNVKLSNLQLDYIKFIYNTYTNLPSINNFCIIKNLIINTSFDSNFLYGIGKMSSFYERILTKLQYHFPLNIEEQFPIIKTEDMMSDCDKEINKVQCLPDKNGFAYSSKNSNKIFIFRGADIREIQTESNVITFCVIENGNIIAVSNDTISIYNREYKCVQKIQNENMKLSDIIIPIKDNKFAFYINGILYINNGVEPFTSISQDVFENINDIISLKSNLIAIIQSNGDLSIFELTDRLILKFKTTIKGDIGIFSTYGIVEINNNRLMIVLKHTVNKMYIFNMKSRQIETIQKAVNFPIVNKPFFYEKKELALFGWVTEIKVFDAKKNSFVASIKSRAFNLINGLCMIRNIQMINGNIFSILAKKKDFDSIIDYIYNKEILKNNDYKVEIDSDFIIFFDNHKLYYISD